MVTRKLESSEVLSRFREALLGTLTMVTDLLRSPVPLVEANQLKVTVVLLKNEGFGTGPAEPKMPNGMRVFRSLYFCQVKTE